jgi:oligopeptide transport system substrate-binding protein
MAIDRQAITQDILGQGQIPSYSFMPRTINGINHKTQYKWAAWPYAKQVAVAKKLFIAAGFSKQHPLKLSIVYSPRADYKKVVLATIAMWQQTFGDAIQTKAINEEWKVWLADFLKGNYQVSRTDWIGDYNYATAFLNLYQCGNPQNTANYCNKKINKLMEKAANTTRKTARIKYNTAAEKIAMQDYAILPVYQYVALHMIKPYVKGYTGKSIMDHIHTKDLSIVDKPKA